MKKRILSALMMICMMLMLFPTLAEASTIPSSELGKNVTLSLETPDVAKIGETGYKSLAEAINAAASEDTITLLADVTASDIIVIDKAITIDGNGHKLTSSATRAINVSGANGVTIKNLTINAAGERAINVIQGATNVTIENVTAIAANYTVNVAGSAANAVININKSALTGLCTVNVAGAGANVTVVNSTINCVDNNTTEGESYAALALNKDATNGKITATGCTINVAEGSDSVPTRNAAEGGVVSVDGSTEGVLTLKAVITYEGSPYYHGFATLADAVEFATAGDTITLIADVTASDIIVVDKAITINGNGHKLTSSATRAINVSGANGVTIKNLTINAAGERAINVIQGATNVTIENVTAIAANYTVNVAGSAANAVININKSALTGLCTVNVAGAGANVTVVNSTINCVDNNTTEGESYAALALNKDATNGKITATGCTINVAEGSDSVPTRNAAEGGVVSVDGSTEGVLTLKAVITYEGSPYYHGFATLADAVEFAKTGDTVTLIADVTIDELVVPSGKTIELDLNGYTVTGYIASGSFSNDISALVAPTSHVVVKEGVYEVHVIKAVSGSAASCTTTGIKDHFKCETCGKTYSDAAGKTELTAEQTVIGSTGHTLTKTYAAAPTCVTDGNTAYWTCGVCTKNYSDEAATIEIEAADTVIGATGKHTYLNGVCTMCGGADPDYKPSEKVEVGTTDTMKDALDSEAANITDTVISTGELPNNIVVDEKTEANIKEVVKDTASDNSVELVFVVEQVATPIEKHEVESEKTTAIETKLDEAKQEIAEESAEKVENQGIVQYLDLSVVIKAQIQSKNDPSEETKTTTMGELKETKEEMEFTITVPDEYLKPGYEVFILRYHEGKVDKLPLTHVEGNIYSFKTNLFSTYALAYVSTHVHTETIINAEGADCGNDGYTGDVVCSTCNELLQEGSVIHADGNHHWSEWKNQEGIAYTFRECWNCGGSEYLNADAPATNVPATGTGAPATGDTSNMFVWVLLMAVCCGAVIGAMVYRKNK